MTVLKAHMRFVCAFLLIELLTELAEKSLAALFHVTAQIADVRVLDVTTQWTPKAIVTIAIHEESARSQQYIVHGQQTINIHCD